MKFFIIISIFISHILATGFNEFGTMSSSMGGAGVSNTDGRYGSYYNPALLNEIKYPSWDVSLGFTFAFKTDNKSIDLFSEIKSLRSSSKKGGFDDAFSNLSKSIQEARTLDNIKKLSNGASISINSKKEDNQIIKSAFNTLKKINDLKLDLSLGTALDLRVKNYALSFYKSASMVIIPHVNDQKTDIIQKVNIPNIDDIKKGNLQASKDEYYRIDLDKNTIKTTNKQDYENNSIAKGVDELQNSKLEIKLRTLNEIPLSYSYRHNLNYNSVMDGYLNLGISAKYMVMQENTLNLNKDSIQNISSKAMTYLNDLLNAKSYHNATFDFAVLYAPNKIKGFKTALVLKNITSPSFSNYNAKAMLRYGLSYTKWNIISSFDIDMTKNKTLSGRDTQIIGGGLGYKAFPWLGFSAGYKMDIAKKEELGEHRKFITLGMHLPLINISVQSVNFDTKNPKSFQINFDLAI